MRVFVFLLIVFVESSALLSPEELGTWLRKAKQAEIAEKTIVQQVQDETDLKGAAEDVFQRLLDKPSSVEPNSSTCSCVNYNCGCCLHMKVDKIHLDDTVCVNISYLPKPEYGVRVTLTVDKTTILNKTVSVRNPPAICVDVPELKQLASLCVQFENLTVKNNTLSGCVYVVAELAHIKLEKLKLGCFTIPPTTTGRMTPVIPRSQMVRNMIKPGSERTTKVDNRLYFQTQNKN